MSRIQMGFATVMHMKESCRTMNTDRDGGGTMDRKELAVALPQIGACIDNSRQYSIALRIYRNTE